LGENALRKLGRFNRTKQEFVEVFLQTLIYCGAPAANDSFRMAAEVWREVEAEQATAK